MKRTLLTSLILLAVVTLTFSQPFASARESAITSHSKTTGKILIDPSRSTPPGTLLYSNPFTCPPYNGLSSESGAPSEIAVDFVLADASVVGFARWWFLFNADPSAVNWIVKIYSNQSCLPSSLLNTWNISAVDVNYENVCDAFGYPTYDCWANLTPAFPAAAGQTYWISVQAQINNFPNTRAFWATYGNFGDIKDCSGTWISSYFGAPNWAPTTDQGATEFAFEIYSSGEVPQTPVSNWALFIGIGLILVFAVVRFRKLV